MNDYGVGYLGSSRSEREARATVEHQTVSNNYIGSSAGVGLDVHAHAHVHVMCMCMGTRACGRFDPRPHGSQNLLVSRTHVEPHSHPHTFAAYGKLMVDMDASTVVTIPLAITRADLPVHATAECTQKTGQVRFPRSSSTHF